MPWKLREYFCEDCGVLVRRNRKSNDPKICVPCGRDRVTNNLPMVNRPVGFKVNSDGEVISP